MNALAKILFLSFLVSFLSMNAQKEDLYKLNENLISVIQSDAPLHLVYEITMESTGEDAVKETMLSNYYKKSKDIFMLNLGDLQTIFKSENDVLMVDNMNGYLIYSADTSNNQNDLLMISEFNAFIDSAVTVNKVNGDGVVTYELSFGKQYEYSTIKLEYDKANNLLKSLDATFNQHPNQRYKYMHVDYKSWDLKWKDFNNQLQLKNFIEKINGKFQPVGKYENYKLITS